MTRWLVRISLLVVLVVVAAGCDWTTFGFLSGGGRNNSTETVIGVANVASLSAAWTASGSFRSSPTVAGGVVYVTGDSNQLEAFDAAGAIGCSGDPNTCAPLWTGTIGGATSSTPAVANGVVYVGADDGKLYAFDAAGTTGCSGTPKTCAPLWTGTAAQSLKASPVVVNGVVYIGSNDGNLYAFDASGATDCSGTPKTCAPLWTAPTLGAISSPAAVVRGVVFVGSDGVVGLSAFDANGSRGCSGDPKICTPLWTGVVRGVVNSSPTVVGGVLYIGSDADRALFAFDAAGVVGCTGTPKYCEPLWTAPGTLHIDSSPAVANGKVYVSGRASNVTGITVAAYDASGTTHCSDTPKVCAPVWSNGPSDFLVMASPAVANGVVYNTCPDGNVYAFDATNGDQLWSAAIGTAFDQSPTVANGVLYTTSSSGLAAFKP